MKTLSAFILDSNSTNNIMPVSCTKLFTDVLILHGADQSVKKQAAMSSSPVYYYYFTYDGDLALTKQLVLSARKGNFWYKEYSSLLFKNYLLRVLCTK
jgi:hypothetical protein